jgi:hypothetical protein
MARRSIGNYNRHWPRSFVDVYGASLAHFSIILLASFAFFFSAVFSA